MMRHVGKLGKVLGPTGKMPSPKSGTVTDKIGQAVREFKAGKVEFRADAGGNVHVPVGKRSFSASDLLANIQQMIDHLRAVRPASVKGVYMRKVSLSSTMSPGLALDVS
jgi:large subunit ribosomal protein L1